MRSFETSVRVEDRGAVRVEGVPFAPEAEVEVTIREEARDGGSGTPAKADEAGVHLRELFARARREKMQAGTPALHPLFARVNARNAETVGPLRREDLYDRNAFR